MLSPRRKNEKIAEHSKGRWFYDSVIPASNYFAIN